MDEATALEWELTEACKAFYYADCMVSGALKARDEAREICERLEGRIQDAKDKTPPIAQRLAEWHAGTDTGMSSKAIAGIMSMSNGYWNGADLVYPRDPGSLGRCLRLLRLIPEWKDRFHLMRGAGPVWAAMVDRWDDLERTMTEEVGIFWERGHAAPRTYALMKSIIDGAR